MFLRALCFTALLPYAASADNTGARFKREIQPLLQKYCFRCHGIEKQKGDVQLSSFHDVKSILKVRKLWLKVIEQIKTEEMPNKPPLPAKSERVTLTAFFEKLLHNYDWDKVKNPGKVTIPRLTRAEYNNTMRDLLGIDYDAGEDFSEDGQGESGFDNDRDALFVTPSLMEKYLAAAERALEALIARQAEPVEYHFESEKMFMTETRETPKQLSEDFLGFVLNRGQMTLYESVDFPYDGLYEFTIRARTTGGPTAARLRLDDVTKADIRITDLEPQLYTRTTFVSKGTSQMAWNILQKRRPPKKKKPLRKKSKGKYVNLQPDWNKLVGQRSPLNAPAYPLKGDETEAAKKLIQQMNRHRAGVQRPYEWLRLLGANGNPSEIIRFKSYIDQRTRPLPGLQKKLAAALGIQSVQLEKKYKEHNAEKLADREKILEAVKHVKYSPQAARLKGGSVAIDWIKIRGPIRDGSKTTASIFGDSKSQDPARAANQALAAFMYRAFRRPVSKREVSRYFKLYERAGKRGDSYEQSVKLAFSAVLVSPHFLFRPEQADSRWKKDYKLDDFELASRLSYFLWLSMPDVELLKLASEGKLQKPQLLTDQVNRMLASPRAKEFAEAFSGQWLGFAPLGKSIFPDAGRFPEFSQDLADAMKQESVLYLQHLIQNNQSLLKLIDTGETFLNAKLAAHYKIEGIKGDEMQLVALEDRSRGGLLGMGSVLTATSNPTRTNPVIRGKWVLETLLGNKLPEPPPDAGELSGDAGQRSRTLREELLLHRRNPTCAACHNKIDPIGFGLENFDAIGRYRTTQAGKPIDNTGELPGGAKFTGPIELKQYIVTHRKGEFIRNISERMLGFALGRKLRYYDEPAIRKIVKAVEEDDYRAPALVRAIVLSYPFRHQSTKSEED